MIYIALGANLESTYGLPAQTLRAACCALEERDVNIHKKSSIWLSAPVPLSDQPWYHNAVIAVASALEPIALLSLLKSIELDFGRKTKVRNAARILDLDIIDYHAQILNLERLTLPHPRMHERAFVLCPLQEVAPSWCHPQTQLDIKSMVDKCLKKQSIKCLEEEQL